MNCKYCNNKMLLDDKDYHFEGCFDIYWVCDNCDSSCFEEVRFGQSFTESWTKDGVEVDFIKKQLNIPKRRFKL